MRQIGCVDLLEVVFKGLGPSINLLFRARDLIGCERVDNLYRFPNAWLHDGYRFGLNLNARQMVHVWVRHGSSPIGSLFRNRIVIRCRAQLWKGSVRAIAIRTFEAFAVVDWGVNGKIRRSRQPISETILVPQAIAKLGSVRVLGLRRRANPAQSENGSQRQNEF